MRHGAVPGASLDDEPQPERSLLARGHREHGPLDAEELSGAAAALVDDVLRRERLGVVFGEPLDAAQAARLLVRHRQEHDVASERLASALQQQEREQLGDPQTLHVERAAAPDLAVAQDAAEGVFVPVLALDGHDVGVVEQQQGRLAPVAAQDSAQGDAIVARVEQRPGDALAFELAAEEGAGGTLVPGRVRGVDAQVLAEETDRLRERCIPLDP